MANGNTVADVPVNNNLPRYLITLLAVGGMIVLRLTGKDLTWTEIALFTIGVLPWFAGFMDSFKFGKDGFEAVFKKELEKVKDEIKEDVKAKAEEITKETTEKINEVKETGEINQSINAFGTGGRSEVKVEKSQMADFEAAASFADPQKGKWGGSSVDEKTHRKLSVKVDPISNNEYLRRVILRVESTAPDKSELVSDVTFHLHPTFNKSVVTVKPVNNAAEISLVAWGAFTVGAVTDNGETELELDIAQHYADSDDPFFNR